MGQPHVQATERVLKDAIASGDKYAHSLLGVILAEQGRLLEAEQAFNEAIAAGIKDAYNNFGVLLAGQKGREAEAEAALRKAVAEGVEGAIYNLGSFLTEQHGREAEAEWALRASIDTGHLQAYLQLGVLLSEQNGREAEAENAFRKAIGLRIIAAIPLLGILLYHQASRRAEGYELLRRARSARIPGAAEMLRRLGREQIANLTRRVRTTGDLYATCKEIDGDRRAGTHILACLRAANHHWVPDRQIFYEPVRTYEELVTLARMNLLLAEAYVHEGWMNHFMVAFRMFESGRTAPLGRLPLPGAGDREIEAHCVALCGFDESTGDIGFVNSWGAYWGDKGHGWLSREYLERYMTDAWLIRRTRYGPTRFNHRRLADASDLREYAKAWMIENPRWRGGRFSHSGLGHSFVIHETISSTDRGIVEVIEIRNGIGVRVAWAHLHHLPERPRLSVLKEFFVWPSFRRQGFGRRLEAAASHRARIWGSQKIQSLFHQIDAWVHVRGAGRRFAESMGYTWRWRAGTHPHTAAIAEKVL